MSEFRRSRWERFCWWLAAALAPKDGSRWGPRVFGRRVLHDTPDNETPERGTEVAPAIQTCGCSGALAIGEDDWCACGARLSEPLAFEFRPILAPASRSRGVGGGDSTVDADEILASARNPDGSQRFYPQGQHPATKRLREALEWAESIENGTGTTDAYVEHLRRQLAEFEYGEDRAKRDYLRAKGVEA